MLLKLVVALKVFSVVAVFVVLWLWWSELLLLLLLSVSG